MENRVPDDTCDKPNWRAAVDRVLPHSKPSEELDALAQRGLDDIRRLREKQGVADDT